MLSCIHPKYATELTSLQNTRGHFILSIYSLKEAPKGRDISRQAQREARDYKF